MEEILASIRRIIADDQSLPAHHADPDVRDATPPAPPEERPEASVHLLRSEPESPGRARVAAIAAEEPPLPEPASPVVARPEATTGFGAAPNEPDGDSRRPTIAAPQFPSPPAAVEQKSFEVEVADPPAAGESTGPRANDARGSDRRVRAAERDTDDYFDPPTEYDRPAAGPSPSLFSAATNSSVSSAFNLLAASRIADNSEELMNLAREMIRPLLKSWLDDNMPSMVERMVREEIERVARGGH